MLKLFSKPAAPLAPTQITLAVFALALFALLLLPPGFSLYPFSAQLLVFFITTLILQLLFLSTLIRHPRFPRQPSPLTLPLAGLFLTLLLSVLINNFSFPQISLLGFAGLFLTFSLTAGLTSYLLHLQNTQIVISVCLGLACLATLSTFLSLLEHYFSFVPDFLTQLLFPPRLGLVLIFLGLAAVFAQFFQKGKFKTLHLTTFFPLIILGLAVNILLCLTPALSTLETPSLSTSFSLLQHQIFPENKLHLTPLLFGSSTQTYTDLLQRYQETPLTAATYHQAFSTPLTLFTLYGLPPVLAYLALIIFTFLLACRRQQPHRQLAFILLVSLIIQVFTPIYPLVLLLQIFLIAAITNKQPKSCFTFFLNFRPSKSSHTQGLLTLIFGFALFCGLTFFSLTLTKNYLGFSAYQNALAATTSADFHHSAQATTTHAPAIDAFRRLTATSKLELAINELNSSQDQQASPDAALDYFYQAIDHAQTAIKIAPTTAENHFTLALLHQEISAYLDEDSRSLNDQQIPSALIQAILLNPNDPDYFILLAHYYQNHAQLQEAFSLYQKALTLTPSDPLIHYQLANAYFQQGDFTKAKSSFLDALTHLDPNTSNYQENLLQIQTQLTEIDALLLTL